MVRNAVRFETHAIRPREIEVERHAVVPRTADSDVEQWPQHRRRQTALDSLLGQAVHAHGEIESWAAGCEPAFDPEWELADRDARALTGRDQTAAVTLVKRTLCGYE